MGNEKNFLNHNQDLTLEELCSLIKDRNIQLPFIVYDKYHNAVEVKHQEKRIPASYFLSGNLENPRYLDAKVDFYEIHKAMVKNENRDYIYVKLK